MSLVRDLDLGSLVGGGVANVITRTLIGGESRVSVLEGAVMTEAELRKNERDLKTEKRTTSQGM